MKDLSKFLVLVIFASALNASCSNGMRARSHGGGVIDGGGGGSFIFHSKDDVTKAIDEVWTEITKKEATNPIFQAALILNGKESRTREENRAHEILERIFSNGPPEWKNTHLIKDTEYVWNRYPHLEMNAMCSGPHDQKYLASVSSLDRTGEICLSVYGLARMPSGSLHNDLIGLIVHEVAHLNGYGEDDAQLIQKYILKNVMRLLLLTGDEERFAFAKSFWRYNTENWPVFVTYGPITAEFISRLAYRGKRLKDIHVPEHVSRRAASPSALKHFDTQLDQLGDDVYAYAEDLYEELKASRTAVLPRHLSTANRLAKKLIEMDRMLHMALFHKDIPLPGNIRSESDLERELALIDRSTDPSLLDPKAADRRPKLYCDPSASGPQSENLSDEVRRLAEQYRSGRCWDETASESSD